MLRAGRDVRPGNNVGAFTVRGGAGTVLETILAVARAVWVTGIDDMAGVEIFPTKPAKRDTGKKS